MSRVGNVDTEEPRVASTLFLAAELNAPHLTRELVKLVLRQWGLAEVIDDAIEVASELAANAVNATLAYEPDYFVNYIRPPAIIRVEVVLYETYLYVAIWDRSLRQPVLNDAATDAVSGRGLQIVNALSLQWGWNTVHPVAGHKGKIVWACLALPHAPVQPALPRRLPGQVIVGTYEPLEPRVLRRVHEGLRRI